MKTIFRIILFTFLFFIIFINSGVSVRESNAGIPASVAAQYRSRIVNEANRWIGRPYASGGISWNGVDCSGLTMNVYNTAGVVSLAHSSQQQQASIYLSMDSVGYSRYSTSSVHDGCIWFNTHTLNSDNSGTASHTGIRCGSNVVHAKGAQYGVVSEPASNTTRYYSRITTWMY